MLLGRADIGRIFTWLESHSSDADCDFWLGCSGRLSGTVGSVVRKFPLIAPDSGGRCPKKAWKMSRATANGVSVCPTGQSTSLSTPSKVKNRRLDRKDDSEGIPHRLCIFQRPISGWVIHGVSETDWVCGSEVAATPRCSIPRIWGESKPNEMARREKVTQRRCDSSWDR